MKGIILSSCLSVLLWPSIVLGRTHVDLGAFSGRVAHANLKAGIIRIHVSFANMKYLNKGDRVSFWNEGRPNSKCDSFVLGKNNDYLLVKLKRREDCLTKAYINNGQYLKFHSQDFAKNIDTGKELVDVLLKKRLALKGKILRHKKELERYMEKVSALNKRYSVLREKLENEWNKELALTEEDRLNTLRNYKNLQMLLNDVDHKLEKYRIEDHNLFLDEWSLDSRQYYRK